jgi:hypothetical protein
MIHRVPIDASLRSGDPMNDGANPLAQLEAMKKAFTALEPLDSDGRRGALDWLSVALRVDGWSMPAAASVGTVRPPFQAPLPAVPAASSPAEAGPVAAMPAGDTSNVTPKEFMAIKRPANDVQRVACLAYYLTHNRKVAHFGTKEIVALNMEAAMHKFGNASQAVTNATKVSGFLAPGLKGKKQITSRGERMVMAMPDAEAMKAVTAELPSPKRPKRKSAGKTK